MRHVDHVTWSTAAALFSSTLAHFFSSAESELYSELLCWLLLPLVFKVAKRRDPYQSFGTLPVHIKAQSSSAASICIVAAGITISCLFKAHGGSAGLVPALVPLLVASRRFFTSQLDGSAATGSRFLGFLADSFPGTSLVSVYLILTLTNWGLWSESFSIILVAALLVVYVVLTPRPRTGQSARRLPPFDIETSITSASSCIVLMIIFALLVETFVLDAPVVNAIAIVRMGLAKASTWFFVVQVSHHSSWYTVAAIENFSLVSSRNPLTLASNTQAWCHVLGSFLTLAQISHSIPKQATARPILWVFFLISLIPNIASTIVIEGTRSSMVSSQQHPVDILISETRVDFDRLVSRQSKSYIAAHEEYRRRYGVEPPTGFREWYDFAQSRQSPIIDDFDAIYDVVSPFWKLSGKEVLEMMNRVQSAPDSELWLCQFSGRDARTQCSHPYRKFDRNFQTLFDTLLRDLGGALPDVKLLVNHLDEPRVLAPPQSPTDGRHPNTHPLNLVDLSRRPIWGSLTKLCSSPSSETLASAQTGHQAETFGLPFVTDIKLAMDLCHHPEYSDMHGLAISPTSFHLVEGLVPILSTGRPSTMNDILYPSAAYIEPEFTYLESHDVDWNQKRKNLYWAGSTTGGVAVDGQWRNFHRQRFVQLAQNLEKSQYSYVQEKSGIVKRIKSSFLNERLFDVAFTRVFQCERRPCRDQRSYFKTRSWAHKDRAFRSQLVFDLDGNGISGRYYRLLASKSAPLKQTIFKEWHDDRLLPWVHYIPVSQGMEELPELVSYLTSTESGQTRAKEVADQGREWFARAFREVDLAIYTYRLLLELARLQDPNRPALK